MHIPFTFEEPVRYVMSAITESDTVKCSFHFMLVCLLSGCSGVCSCGASINLKIRKCDVLDYLLKILLTKRVYV